MADGSVGVVRNIPGKFRSVDLKNFFSDFVENEKFKCFHFKHRPEVVKQSNKNLTTEKDTSKTQKTGTCCCVFQSINEESLADFVQRYNGTSWVDAKGEYLTARCIIHKIRISNDNSDNEKGRSVSSVEPESSYFTRAEKSYKKRHAISEDFSSSDMIALSELRPPVAVMPRGNVGTTTKEFMKLIRDCKLPPSIIKKLDLKFPLTGSTRRYGNVNMVYTDTFEEIEPGKHTYTAKGDVVDFDLKPSECEGLKKAGYCPETEENATSTDNVSGPDDDDDTCEEWERHEALRNDVTSQGRTKERLFEEKIELKWEKGGSGLVFYTDAQYWREQEGDFDEQTTDDWDVDMSEYYGGRGDLDARQYLQMRREKRRGKAVYDDSLSDDLKPRKRPSQARSRSESPPSVKSCRGAFEKHTKGVGRKLLEKGGWKEGDPLGPQQRPGAITDPVQLDGQDPREKRGLGFHGEKLLRSGNSNNPGWGAPQSLRTAHKFRNTRSREPLASSSAMFPEYAFNLPNNEFTRRGRTKAARKQAVPGPDDGVVITTVYDDPLCIDEPDEFLRSRHPTALKRRAAGNVQSNEKHQEQEGERLSSGSKLVLRGKRSDKDDGESCSRPTSSGLSRTVPLHLSTVKFVRGGVLDET